MIREYYTIIQVSLQLSIFRLELDKRELNSLSNGDISNKGPGERVHVRSLYPHHQELAQISERILTGYISRVPRSIYPAQAILE